MIKGFEAQKQRPCKLLWMLWFDEKCILSRKLENSMALYQKKVASKDIWDKWHLQYMSDSRWFLGETQFETNFALLKDNLENSDSVEKGLRLLKNSSKRGSPGHSLSSFWGLWPHEVNRILVKIVRFMLKFIRHEEFEISEIDSYSVTVQSYPKVLQL